MDVLSSNMGACSLLIVEDNRVNAEMLYQHLERAGFSNLFLAVDGQQALEMTQDLHPDLVVLDMMMPRLDGFGYCQAVRAIPEFAAMPIIVQTALEKQEDKLRAFEMGASDYITKPVHGAELVARVRVHLMNRLLHDDVLAREEQLLAELRAAQRMQKRLMPSEEQLETLQQTYPLDIASHFEPSSTMGGDFWTVRPLGNGRVGLAMFDFSGHGVAAALNVFRMHTLMQELAIHAGEPGGFLTLLNRALFPLLERSEFATMFYGIIDLEKDSFEYAAAAASPTLLYHRDSGEKEWLDIRGVPLGAIVDAQYDTVKTHFLPGDSLVMFSDCLIETPNPDGQVMCRHSIAEMIAKAQQGSAVRTADSMMAQLLAQFRAHSNAPLRDDLTLAIYHRKE